MYICIYQIHIQVCDTMCIVLVFVVLHSQLCICPFQMHYVIHKWASCLSMLSQPVCSCSFNDNSSVTSLSFTGRYRWVYRLNCSFTSTQQVPWHKEHSWLWQKKKVEWSEQKSNCIKTKSKCLNRYHYDAPMSLAHRSHASPIPLSLITDVFPIKLANSSSSAGHQESAAGEKCENQTYEGAHWRGAAQSRAAAIFSSQFWLLGVVGTLAFCRLM